jgi:hypothetical protein
MAMQAARSVAQVIALTLGSALLAVGVLALIFGSTDFAIGSAIGAESFLIWLLNGWGAVIWTAFGIVGLLSAARADTARAFALVAGAFFAAAAVWGFIDGDNAFGLMAVDTTVNISHAVIAAVGLVTATMPAPSVEAGRPGRHEPPGTPGAGHPAGI